MTSTLSVERETGHTIVPITTLRTVHQHPSGLDADELEAFGKLMDDLRNEIISNRGKADADYIHRVIAVQRRLEVAGRLALFAGVFPPFWVAGAAMLSTAKILENMEIGHNVMHGQWDWMRDPEIHSSTWEWDNVCPSDQWKHSHNEIHHTWTNVIGRDRDVGYGILRIDERQPWSKVALGQPVYAAVLATLFQWGVALHDVEIEEVMKGRKTKADAKAQLAAIAKKGGRQLLKDYVLFPAMAGPFFLPVLVGNLTANVVRNLWTFSIIFCGHFPDGVERFTEEDVVDETRGGWYARQVLGSANIEGSKVFHILSGNLSHQIEHHLFPDLPSNRYGELAPRVRAICEQYGIPYNSRSFSRQFGSVIRRIARRALPG
jgi:linoleoyl-CoA desaturase